MARSPLPDHNARVRAIGLSENPKVDKKASSEYEIEIQSVYSATGISVTPELKRTLEPLGTFFKKMNKPKPCDWLAERHEPGQTFEQFAKARKKQPDAKHNKIYIVPLSYDETSVQMDVCHLVAEFATCFYGIPVEIKEEQNLKSKVTTRTNPNSGHFQLNAEEILQKLQMEIPEDAFCVAGMTLCDIYPNDDYNFVFGLASSKNRVGVYSLARYMPDFWSDEKTKVDSSKLTEQARADLLLRTCRVMVHEAGHMFGLKHCIYYKCLMNGSNHFEESDSHPFNLCPVCLRKLHLSCKFDIVGRYERMADFCNKNGLPKQADWFRRRVQYITGT